MADVGHQDADYPDYLGRLHLRFPRGYRPKTEQRTPEHLADVYKSKANIRSKYKGTRGAETGATSGIPIFGNEDAADRLNWSVGHTAARQGLQENLIREAAAMRVPPSGVSAENSHALGHADYGTDHELSAPAASKAQNTEQLAIELAMRAAAQHLNQGQDPDASLVHAKITDVLHPETGQLMARRFKLIRREDAADKQGTVVFDHLMDGRQLHISKEDAFARGRQAYEALMRGSAADRVLADAEEMKPKAKSGKAKAAAGKGRQLRKGMQGTAAPSRMELMSHQYSNLAQLQKNRLALKKEADVGIGPVPDRKGVSMIGPAFTDAQFPGELGPEKKSGQAALDEHRAHMARYVGTRGQPPESFLESGGLPAGNEANLLRHVGVLENTFGSQLGEAGSLIAHGMKDTPDQGFAEHIKDMVAGKFPARQMGREDALLRLREAGSGASKALKALEDEKAGSGLQLLTEDQQRLLMAAHIYRNATIDEYKPVLKAPEEAAKK
ncbi:MAG: hypothetical protein ABJN40_17925 [Sneathiella sp.]